MASAQLKISCRCGQTVGSLADITPSAGAKLQCHCDDCRRAVVWLGQPDPGPDGITYYQTTPDRVSIDASQLAAFTWKNKRLLRWYAPCCNTAMFNTLDTPKWAFVSLPATIAGDDPALGPVHTRAFIPRDNGKRGHEKILSFMWGFLKRTATARLSGTWRTTAFFDETGAPNAPVQSLTKEDRASARL